MIRAFFRQLRKKSTKKLKAKSSAPGAPYVPRPAYTQQLVVKSAVAVRETVLPTSFQGDEYSSKMAADLGTMCHAQHTIGNRPIIYNYWCPPAQRCYRYRTSSRQPQQSQNYWVRPYRSPLLELCEQLGLADWHCILKTMFLQRNLRDR